MAKPHLVYSSVHEFRETSDSGETYGHNRKHLQFSSSLGNLEGTFLIRTVELFSMTWILCFISRTEYMDNWRVNKINFQLLGKFLWLQLDLLRTLHKKVWSSRNGTLAWLPALGQEGSFFWPCQLIIFRWKKLLLQEVFRYFRWLYTFSPWSFPRYFH